MRVAGGFLDQLHAPVDIAPVGGGLRGGAAIRLLLLVDGFFGAGEERCPVDRKRRIMRSTTRPEASSRRTFSSTRSSGTMRPLMDCIFSVISVPLGEVWRMVSGPSEMRWPLMSTAVVLETVACC